MKKAFWATICLVCTFSLAACDSINSLHSIPQTAQSDSTEQTVQSDDIKFTIITDKDKYTIGDKITVTVKATNISKKTIYTVDGTTSYYANGLGLWLGSIEHGFRFCNDYKNVAMNAMMYYGELKPGETITREQTFDTSDISYYESGWRVGFIENLPEISITAILSHTELPRGESTIEPYTCSVPVNIESKAIDSSLAQELGIYPINLVTKLLLTNDADEIAVWIWFDDIAASQKYIDDNFANRMDKILYNGHFSSSVVVKLPRLELIQMAKTRFSAEVQLY
ncbi:MAG: hypothetical protein FWE97_02440 [Dehalococcoidia bacterium]|nr:hypothetical protein [Dehalococcoidia bacterium]